MAKPKINWLKLVAVLAITAVGFLLLPEKWQFLLVASVVLAILLIPAGVIRTKDPLNSAYRVLKVTLGLVFLWGAFAPNGLWYRNNSGYRYWAENHWPSFKPPTAEEERRPYFKTIGQTPLYAQFNLAGPDSLVEILPIGTVVQAQIETAATTIWGDNFIRVIYTAGKERLNGWVKFNLLEKVDRKSWQQYVASSTPSKPTMVQTNSLITPATSVLAIIDPRYYSSSNGWEATGAGNMAGHPGYNGYLATTDEIWCHGNRGVITYNFSIPLVPTSSVQMSFAGSSEFKPKAPDPSNDQYSSDVKVKLNNQWSTVVRLPPDDGFGQEIRLEIPSEQFQINQNQLQFEVGQGKLSNGLTIYTRQPIRLTV